MKPKSRWLELHIAAAGHVTEISGPVQALYNYLRRRETDFSFAMHPFSYSKVEASIFEWWRGGKCQTRREARYPRFFALAANAILNFLWFGVGRASDIFIGIDNFNAACGIILRAFGRVRRCVYYVIDYTPRRFENRFMNGLYHAIDRFAARHADEVWNISPRIAEIRRRQGVADAANMVVGVGVDFTHIVPAARRSRTDLVIVSHLTKSKGVQLAIESMRSLATQFENVRLFIVGVGPYEHELRELVHSYSLESRVIFTGLMDHPALFAFLPACGIALAPYEEEPGSITYYADPTKPKEYLACGLPVIITDVPAIARTIAEEPMGICIRYDAHELETAVKRLLTDDDFYQRCTENATAFSRHLDWSAIYDRAFEVTVK